jgi:hypothetical protein
MVLLAAGCEKPPQPVTLDTTGVTPAVDYAPLAKVLEQAVSDRRRLSPGGLSEAADALLQQAKLLAVTGPTATPELFPSSEARIAYWYNARCTWSMKLALDCGCPKRMRRADLTDRPFPLDGRTMTLEDIDDRLAEQDDFRVLVASPGVCVQRAALPEEPFTADGVRERVAGRFEAFIDDPERFPIDVAARSIRVPPVLWRLRERIIGQYEQAYQTQGAMLSTALLPHVSGSARRRLHNAVGYDCVPAPSKCEPALVEE